MKIENILKIVFVLFISIIAFVGCTNEFEYGKSQNAVKTLEYSNVLQTTATIFGTIITDNGVSLSARGICYGIDSNPTISGLKKPDTEATLGSFTCILTNLSPSTTYFARAYATNDYGTAYGEEVSFKTQAATIPIISSTIAASLITQISASSGGIITNTGASNITGRGVCYSNTNSNPTISNSRTNDGVGIGQYTSSLINLTPNTIYYIRAYATNGLGTAYGDVKVFTTTSATIPVVLTTAASFISQTTAISGGSVISESGASVISRGVCWSNTTSMPTILNYKTLDGNGLGAFTSSLTSLSPGITYYVRAYATNSVGTAYGPVISVITLSATIPTGVTTNTISSITQTTATSGGNISNDGGASVTSRGVCWSNITANPTIANTKTIDGSGIGTFSSSLTGLTPASTYYVRAYATNSAGTAYGSMKSFTTQSATIPQGIITTPSFSITQTTGTCGGSITSDGGATITMKGVCWSSTTSTPTISNTNTNNGTGSTSFSSSLSSLTANTTYYIRAYALNSVGIGYGNTVTFTTLPNLAIGQSYQGGIIAYIFVSGDSDYVAGQTHGLIATTTNQSTGAQWGCSGTSIAGTSTALGTGLANTTAIVNVCITSGIAARICNDLVSGGYSDWYLPSTTELQKLYNNSALIGGFISYYYLSSSQISSTNVYGIDFSNGFTYTLSKTSALYVRAIRKF